MSNFVHRPMTDEERRISAYEGFAADLADGYSMSIYEYTNDMSNRQFIEERREDPAVARQWKRVEEADAILKKILIPTKRCIHGDYPNTHFWYWGYPPNSPELEADLRKMGAI